jgi:hypothetical protein
MVKEAEDKV